ncbi:putative reverse transcriptase domain-containing protein [Tanacetum coccineum]
MDLVTRLPRIISGYDAIWVIVDRLTKSAHFLPIREDFKMEKLARIYINEIMARHDVPVLIISDRDGRFSSHFCELFRRHWQLGYSPPIDSDWQVPLEEIKIDDKLYFVEEPVEIVDRQVKKFKRSWIPIVKVLRILEEELNLLRSKKINSKSSTHTFSPPHCLLQSPVELWGPEFP